MLSIPAEYVEYVAYVELNAVSTITGLYVYCNWPLVESDTDVTKLLAVP